MQVDRAASSPGGALANVLGTRTVVSAATGPGGPVFRTVLHLRIPTGGHAERIRVDAEGTALEAMFQPLDYDALTPPAAELEASVSERDGALMVELDAPRRVLEVELGARTATFGGILAFHRVDGDTIATEPTVTGTVQPAPVFAKRRSAERAAAVSEVTTKGGAIVLAERAGVRVDFTDVRFALRLVGATGATVSLRPSDITGLRIRSFPGAPRFRLGPANSPADWLALWQTGGQIGASVPADTGRASAGDALTKTLQRHLDRIADGARGPAGEPQPLSAEVEVALVAESDAPCRLQITDFKIEYYLAREALAGFGDRKVLRFADFAAKAVLPLPVPADADLGTAELVADAAFDAGRPLEATVAPGEPPSTGVLLEPDRAAAAPVLLSEAATLSGVALRLQAMGAEVEIAAELRADWQGRATGERLTGGSARLKTGAGVQWLRIAFETPAVVSSARHWLLVRGRSRRSVWLTAEAPGETRLLTRADGGGWREQETLAGRTPLYHLMSAMERVQTQPALQLAIDEVPAVIAGAGDPLSFEFAAALNTFLRARAAGHGLIEVPLTFEAATAGLVTVYPPRLEYELI